MRSRKEMEDLFDKVQKNNRCMNVSDRLMIELLLDIRDLLTELTRK